MGTSKLQTSLLASVAFASLLLVSACEQQKRYPSWLLGEWKTRYNNFAIRETWKESKDGYEATTVWNDNGKRMREHVALFYNKKSLIYRVETKRRTVDFVCDKPHDDTLVFVNQQNDYPKRIVYVKPKGENMTVWIDKYENDPEAEYFPFVKVNWWQRKGKEQLRILEISLFTFLLKLSSFLLS